MKVKCNEQGLCPKCESNNLDYGCVQFDGNMCYFPYICAECGTQGEEWYSMEFEGHNIKTENDLIEIEDYMIDEESEY